MIGPSPRRAALDGRQAQKQSRRTGTSALGRNGKGDIRCGTDDRCAHHLVGNATGSGMTDGGRRGDSKASQRCRAIARLGTCESARGPDADRHVKLLSQFAVEGSLSGAYSHPDLKSRRFSRCPNQQFDEGELPRGYFALTIQREPRRAGSYPSLTDGRPRSPRQTK
jgi:hypothetical protein